MIVRNVTAVAVMLVASAALADEGRFTASSVPHARLRKRGRVVISNDSRSINAYHFYGNIRESLVSLRSAPVIGHSFGSAVFNATARVPARVPAEIAGAIQEAGKTHGVDPRLVAAVARRESGWDPRALSSRGACGLMQLMPETARYLGVGNIFDVRENIFGGARYLRTLLDTFHGDLDLTLAAYNAGPGAVAKYKGVPPYPETKAYVAAVKANYLAALAQ